MWFLFTFFCLSISRIILVQAIWPLTLHGIFLLLASLESRFQIPEKRFGPILLQKRSFCDHSTTLSLKRIATFLRGFFLGPRVRVMWPRVIRIAPYSLASTLLQKKDKCNWLTFRIGTSLLKCLEIHSPPKETQRLVQGLPCPMNRVSDPMWVRYC